MSLHFATLAIIIAVVGCTILPTSDNVGAAFALTEQAVNVILNEGYIPLVESMMTTMSIPDISGTTPTSIGRIEYSVHGIEISDTVFGESIVIFNVKEQMIQGPLNFKMTISFSYSYRQLSFPYLNDKGVGTISSSSIFHLGFQIYRTENGGIFIAIPQMVFDIETFHISLDSPMSWLYDLIFALFEDSMAEAVEIELTNAMRIAVDAILEEAQKEVPFCIQWISGIGQDLRMTQPIFNVHPSFIQVPYSAATAILQPLTPGGADYQCTDDVFDDNLLSLEQFPQISGEKHVQAIISGGNVRKYLQDITAGGHFTTSIIQGVTPASIDVYTRNSFWEDVATGISTKHPDAVWSVDLVPRGGPKDVGIEFFPSSIRVTMKYDMHLTDRNTGAVVVLNTLLAFAAKPVVLYGSCFSLEMSSISGKLTGASDSSFKSGEYTNDALVDICDDVLTPHMAAVLSNGLWVSLDFGPTVPTVSMENVEFTLHQENGGYLVHGADIIVRTPQGALV